MFSAKAHYGLKAIMYLGQQAGKGPVQAKEIAAKQNIPVRYLELLLSQLKKARLIDSSRGKSGGYYLAGAASAIKVHDVIVALEGPVIFISSHEVKDNDRIEQAVSHFWKRAEDNLIEYLQGMTVDDLLNSAQKDDGIYNI